jgi:hypothetical protein
VSDKADKLRIEYMPVEKLQEAPRNPKHHSLEEIKQSMRRFGFVQAPAINETTGRLVAGHGRKARGGVRDRPFKKNVLKRKKLEIPPGPNEYGMKLVVLPPKKRPQKQGAHP